MKREYATELRELPLTYESCLRAATDEFEQALGWSGPTIFVGSGGALAAARLAADLHISHFGTTAVATTPLLAATSGYGGSVGVVLFSARGRHPDAAMTVRAARSFGAQHIGVVSARGRDDLPDELGAPDVSVATVPTTADGFLATNSVLAMAAATCRAHGYELPTTLPAFIDPELRLPRRSLLVLYTPGLSAVAHDLEARLTETGLADVQMADFRNVAHGRHVGLMRRASEITVVAIIDQVGRHLADRTIQQLPPDIDVLRIESDLTQPASALDLLVKSMQLTGVIGAASGVDPGRPGVAEFGRRLYHLPTSKLVPTTPPGPVGRKCRAAIGLDPGTAATALEEWIERTSGEKFGGLVLDYDGTCCPTWDRFRPPPADVRQQLCRLLEGGLQVAFASGRGRSLHSDTRAWLPAEYWDRVMVGLYNGTLLLPLSDGVPEVYGIDGSLEALADRLEGDPLAGRWAIERRPTQLSIATAAGGGTGEQILAVVRALIGRAPALPCKALASGHSVDVVLADAGKPAVVQATIKRTGQPVMAFGDQGQPDGNDFELLAAVSASLSVDRCSADLTRCWNLDVRGESGPDLLVRYLKSIKINRSSARFRWTG